MPRCVNLSKETITKNTSIKSKPVQNLELYEFKEDIENNDVKTVVSKVKKKKVHRCPVCGDQFAYKSSMTRHLIKHDPETDITCINQWCDYRTYIHHKFIQHKLICRRE